MYKRQATLAVALDCARKSKVLRKDMVSFGIPLFANIHLCGPVLTEVFFCMTISKILYGKLPGIGTMILFCLLLGIFAIGAPGVPGGTVMASLGLITGVLMFDDAGTALMLADAVSEGLDYTPRYVFDRHDRREKRAKAEIGFSSIRGGTIVGEHEVIFAGHDEIVTVTHTAMSKEIFAVGALNAALYLAGRPAGLYSVKDFIAGE